MSSATLTLGAPLDNTMGAMLIGIIISAALHGITLVQAFYYFNKYGKDPIYLKGLVATTVCFDAIHLCFITHTIYHYLVTSYHDEDKLRHLVWSVLMEALLTGVNGSIVQLFFTLRVWRLSHKNYIFSGIIVALILSCASCGTAWVILSMQLQTFEQLLRISPLTITINALSTSIDILIAGSLIVMLRRARTGFKRTDTIIRRLVVFIVSTGLLTTVCAISSLISLISSPNTLIYATFYFCIGRLYTNSFLATLNARKSASNDVDNSHMMVSLPTSVSQNKNQQNISIRVDTTKEAIDGNTLEMQRSQTTHGQSEDDLHGQKTKAL